VNSENEFSAYQKIKMKRIICPEKSQHGKGSMNTKRQMVHIHMGMYRRQGNYEVSRQIQTVGKKRVETAKMEPRR
jgi:3-hydroxymyristoyl/3-hydroxydecanoyl-(acyl carrier protein) dehydratase